MEKFCVAERLQATLKVRQRESDKERNRDGEIFTLLLGSEEGRVAADDPDPLQTISLSRTNLAFNQYYTT